MIAANELRIGNWVNLMGRPLFICWIDLQILDCCKPESPMTPEVYTPIPLTPEILEKAGFKEADDEKGFFKHKKAVFQIDLDDAGVYIAVVSISGIGVLENVHQLQNLYYSIMKEELNIEL